LIQPPSANLTSTFRIVILMPVFQDWECAAILCKSLEERLAGISGVEARILLVDDGSIDEMAGWQAFDCNIQVDILRLRRNLGHQRAICTGLCYIHDNVACDAILVMDADGEDRPEDAVRLIELGRSNAGKVVFAERRKRQEGTIFRIGYALYRFGHLLLTGIRVRVGNFSIVPFAVLRRLVFMPELWNHFAGAVYKSKAHFECVPMDRGKRLHGRSHMNLYSLVVHGIAGIATFHELAATRILITNMACLALLTVSFLVIVAIRLYTDWAIAGWATYTIGFVLILAIQLAAISFSLVFTLMSNRSSVAVVPSRDCLQFVDRIYSVSPRR
jgi:hypothetical protein